MKLLESGQIKVEIDDYIETYNQLIENSSFLKNGFNHYHAKTVQQSLTKNGFFEAGHSVNLFDSKANESLPFNSPDDLEKKLEQEKEKILSNANLKEDFEKIDAKLKNDKLRAFRDYLYENRNIITKLSEYKQLQKDIWISYLAEKIDLFNAVIEEYRYGKEIIEEVVHAAKEEKTAWEEVVEIFNKRFSVPFKIAVENQEDVILKGTSPRLSFTFVDPDPERQREVDKDLLLNVLSQGERKALYILNILFELNARKKQGIKTILIVDDIADSFDYKNKYAIVEYLKEVSEINEFYVIFLTHNYDFHRTTSLRLNIPRENRLFAVLEERGLKLSEEKYQKNPFDYWKNNIDKPRFLISSIPFVRNLAECCGDEECVRKLTSLLHIKDDTRKANIRIHIKAWK